jgi:branched-chain amino acid transport system permease protein
MADAELLGQSVFNLIQFTLRGVLSGGIYALVALGIVIINKASGVFNFAHGWMMFVGGLFFWQIFQNGASNQVTFGLSVATTLLVIGTVTTMGIGIAPRKPASPNDEGGDTKKPSRGLVGRLEKAVRGWMQLLSNRQFQIALIPAILAGVAVAFLLNLEDSKILRGAVAAFVGSILVGMFIERFTIRPLLGQSLLTAILMTLAIGFIMQGVTQLIWGADEHPIPIFVEEGEVKQTAVLVGRDADGNPIYTYFEEVIPPRALPDYTINTSDALGEDIRIQRPLLWGFIFAIATFVGFVLLFQYTSIGLAMRATAENQVLAESVGLRVRLILAVVWALVAIIAAIAGVVQGAGASLSALLIPALALRVFPAVLLGGLDSITGALVGGIIIGIVEQLSILFISTTAAQEFTPFIVLIIVLYFKPTGLFGQKRIDRV